MFPLKNKLKTDENRRNEKKIIITFGAEKDLLKSEEDSAADCHANKA